MEEQDEDIPAIPLYSVYHPRDMDLNDAAVVSLWLEMQEIIDLRLVTCYQAPDGRTMFVFRRISEAR